MIQRDTQKKAHLGDLLVKRGLITPEQKAQALLENKKTGRRIGEVLIEMGAISEEDTTRILAEQTGLPYVRLRRGLADPKIAQLLSREKAELHGVLPLFRIHDRLILAVSDPHRIDVFDIVRKMTGCDVQPVVALRADIAKMIEESYVEGEARIEDLVSSLDETDLEVVSDHTSRSFEDIAEMAGESPIINLVNQVILRAIKESASDVHIEPERSFFRVRFRIDGMLYEVMRHRIEFHAPVVSRLKIMANLDIAERRLPQDGRIQVLAIGRTVDLRFSSMPSVVGEKIVLRILDKESGVLGPEELGFSPEALRAYRGLLHKPHGLVLVTGPTGSGKTTTLYAGIHEMNSLEKNIITIEDPVEYKFEIVNQNQVKDEIGLTFARILKHILRQDPDIIMVGEIRDAETAQIAVQAALTGHLVLSTMHTNDASSSVTRLLEMGIEPYLLASSLIGVIGQRLARSICGKCAVPYHAPQAELDLLGVTEKEAKLRKGEGCEHCYDSGYRGRLGVYELIVVDAEMQALLFDNPTAGQIREYQVAHALATLRSEAIKRVVAGETTLEEVTRSVFID